MIYCNLSDDSRRKKLKIQGRRSDICDELAAIIAELIKTDEGKHLVCAAAEQGIQYGMGRRFDKEIRQFPDPNRRKV